MKTNEISSRSPKNRYFADITLLNKCYAGGGNTNSIGASTLDECRRMADAEVARLGDDTRASVVIRENIAEYPAFDWRESERYSI